MNWINQHLRILAFGFLLMFCSSAGQTYFIALFGGEIRASLDISHGEFGSIYSFATFGSAVILLWSSKWVDRFQLRTVTLCTFLGLGIAAGMLASVQSLLALFVAILLLRQFGQGLLGTISVTTMMRYVPAHRAKANAISYTGYSAAEALLPATVVALLAVFAWREIWFGVAAILCVLMPLVVVGLTKRETPASSHTIETQKATVDAHHSQSPVRSWQRSEVLKDPLFYAIVPGLTCQSMLYTGYMFHQVYLVEQKGWSLALWASLYALFSITAIVMNFVISAWVDRAGPLRVVPWINVPMIVALVVLAYGDSMASAAVFMTLMAISTAAQAACSGPFFAVRYGNQHLASVKSLGTFFMVLMTAVSPIVLGLMIDASVSISGLAVSGAVYALVVSTAAWVGCGIAR